MIDWQEIPIRSNDVELIVADNVALSHKTILICEGGTLALTAKALIFRPPNSKVKWSMDLKIIKDLKREASGYLSNGKIRFIVDANGNDNGNVFESNKARKCDFLTWQCQVCEEINESKDKEKKNVLFNCKMCGSLQKGKLLEVKIDENKEEFSAHAWTCEVCEDLNESVNNFCSSCGFGRPLLGLKIPVVDVNWICSNCTFINYDNASTENSCQVCEAPKPSNRNTELIHDSESKLKSKNFYKLTFRSGGSTLFFAKLNLVKAEVIKTEFNLLNSESESTADSITVGISGLLKRHEERTLATEASLSSAFSDLDALMRTAEEMVQLATKISDKIHSKQSKSVENNGNDLQGVDLSVVEKNIFKDLVESLGIESITGESFESDVSGNGTFEFYDSIARGVAALVQVLINKTGTRVYSLADVYCIYNRTRTTGSLIAPADLLKAARLMSRIGLPVRLHKFTSKGILCLVPVQDVDPLHLYILIQQIIREKGNYVTAVDLAEKLKISLFLASQQLNMAEVTGKIVRDGKRKDLPAFFVNKFLACNF